MSFDRAGAQNTGETLAMAFDFAEANQIGTVVVASTTGGTGVMAAEIGRTRGMAVIVVTHNYGFKDMGQLELTQENREKIVAAGATIHTGTMVLRGLGSAVRKKHGSSDEEMVASVLRLFGQGMKVCVEMAAMVSDAGLVPGGDVVCVAGTAKGADTAALIALQPSNKLFDLKVREIIVKPRDF